MTLDLVVHEGDLTAALPEIDAVEVLAATERADWALLWMVSSAGVATLALAAASTFFA